MDIGQKQPYDYYQKRRVGDFVYQGGNLGSDLIVFVVLGKKIKCMERKSES